MIFVHHRRNTPAELAQSRLEWGVEIDLRNHGDAILVTHDPFSTDAVRLEDWLDGYQHRFLIANVKEEGLEPRLLEQLAERKIVDFFILDESFPYIRKYAREGLSNFAVRVSEYESPETALNLSRALFDEGRMVDWIWADSFSGRPLADDVQKNLRGAGYRICVVSPELHHVADPASWEDRIERFVAQARGLDGGLRPEMVCTKRPDLWSRLWPDDGGTC